MAHVSAAYWDLEAATTTDPKFTATLQSLDGKRIATGKDFDSLGVAKDGIVVINEERANQLTAGLQGKSLDVRSVEEKPYRKSPKAPFMTSTLQQEGGNKLRITASEVMRLAQGLYEAGYITYMRTDAVILGAEALGAVRDEIINTYGDKFLATEPRVYKSKVKNAQEAHEAIRPSLPLRSPESLADELRPNELALYARLLRKCQTPTAPRSP
jgi:DNA topoisomerase-1